MKKSLTSLTLVFIVTTIFGLGAYAKPPKNSERRQAQRIRQGVKSGELTKKETRQLIKQQKRIKNTRKKALIDGKMTKKERAKLMAKKRRANKNIYRKKHNQKKNPEATAPAVETPAAETAPPAAE